MTLHRGSCLLVCIIFIKQWVHVSSTTTPMGGTTSWTSTTAPMEGTTPWTSTGTTELTTTTATTTIPWWFWTTHADEFTTSTHTSTDDGTVTRASLKTSGSPISTTINIHQTTDLTSDQTMFHGSDLRSETTSSLSISSETTPTFTECQCKKVTTCADSVVSQEDFNIAVAVLSVFLLISVLTILILIYLLRRQNAQRLKTETGAPDSGGASKSENMYMDLQKTDSTEPIYKSLNTSETALDQRHVYHNVEL